MPKASASAELARSLLTGTRLPSAPVSRSGSRRTTIGIDVTDLLFWWAQMQHKLTPLLGGMPLAELFWLRQEASLQVTARLPGLSKDVIQLATNPLEFKSRGAQGL